MTSIDDVRAHVRRGAQPRAGRGLRERGARRRLGARLVIVGADFHFGHRRHGTVRLLEQMGAELGFEVLGLGLVPVEGDPSGMPYSSTRIRELLAQGQVVGAARPAPGPRTTRSVGRSRWGTCGAASSGSRRPTSTSRPACLPADGIYAGTFVDADGIERPTAISLGRRPTFYEDAESSLLEAHLLDFDGDLYGQAVKVRFVERLRGEERFDSVDALVEQMGRDVEAARAVLGPEPDSVPGPARPWDGTVVPCPVASTAPGSALRLRRQTSGCGSEDVLP